MLTFIDGEPLKARLLLRGSTDHFHCTQISACCWSVCLSICCSYLSRGGVVYPNTQISACCRESHSIDAEIYRIDFVASFCGDKKKKEEIVRLVKVLPRVVLISLPRSVEIRVKVGEISILRFYCFLCLALLGQKEKENRYQQYKNKYYCCGWARRGKQPSSTPFPAPCSPTHAYDVQLNPALTDPRGPINSFSKGGFMFKPIQEIKENRLKGLKICICYRWIPIKSESLGAGFNCSIEGKKWTRFWQVQQFLFSYNLTGSLQVIEQVTFVN